MATKRVFEIAKELGIKSKSIVDKCHQEGISNDVIKNHMSKVSTGLEQTIRDWFDSDPLYFDGRELEFVVDPGSAPAEEIGQLFFELSKLYRMIDGSGITFKPDDVREIVRVLA